MILSQPPAFQPQDALRGPRINLDLAEDQPLPVPLERNVLILNQPVEVGAAQMQVTRHLVNAERPVRHRPMTATAPPPGTGHPVAGSNSVLLGRFGPPPGLLVNLIEGAAVVARQFELGQDVADIPLLLDLLVEEPLEERQRGVILLRGGQFVNGADRGGDLLFVAEAGLEGIEWRLVVALGFREWPARPPCRPVPRCT